MKRLDNLENINIPSVNKLPPKAGPENKIFKKQKSKSLLIVPMISGRSLAGFISLDAVKAQRTWSDREIELLVTIADIVVNALERKQAEEALRRTRFSVDQAQESIFWINTDGMFLDINDAACRELGSEFATA